ncbi:MAG TPA: BTAD domain-containing putative transcriptional regulator, partial [Terrimesophilobacter sp.]|nr:BTAD domain-containing putative transcriptional regulator [Terrimesophilobacter sp.]
RNYLVTVTILAELAATIGTEQQVELLRDALLPYANQAVPVGFGLAFWGTVARTLGMLSIRLERYDEARTLLRTAIDVCARSGAQAWLAESQLELADLEIKTHGDLNEAHSLAQQAEATSRALGFPALHARAEITLSRLPHENRTATQAVQSDDGPQRVHIRILGVFDVTAHDGTKARWSSRKARELLKILIARRGGAASREALMHELWPDIDPDRLANRFSVALSTIRRTLDPARQQPAQHYIATDGDTLRLNHTAVRLDIDEFYSSARRDDIDSLRHATELYTGDAFVEEPYADWASPIRHQAQATFCAAAKVVAAHDNADGNHLAASALYRRILELEPFDETAHNGLITALTELGAEGQASAMRLKRDLLREELAG